MYTTCTVGQTCKADERGEFPSNFASQSQKRRRIDSLLMTSTKCTRIAKTAGGVFFFLKKERKLQRFGFIAANSHNLLRLTSATLAAKHKGREELEAPAAN